MAINAIQGGGAPQGLPPQQVRLARPPILRPQLGAALPRDTVGLKSKGGPINRFSPDRRLSDLKPDELTSLGGGSALETLARTQSNLTIGEARPLLGNKPALESIAGLMEERSDLKVSDFVSRDVKGRVQIDPSYKDPEAMAFLKERQDISPSEVSAMRSNFTKKLKDPQLGKQATTKGLELLRKRTDMKPEDVTEMFTQLHRATGADKKGAAGADPAAGAQATMDMFDSASKLLVKRSGISPEQVGELAGTIGKLGSPKDKQRAGRVAEGFKAATQALEKNPLRQPQEMGQLATTVAEHFKGNDEKSAEHRMNAFKTGAKMMGENTQIGAADIGGVFRQAKQSNPKATKGSPAQQSKALSGALTGVAQGVSNGTLNTANLGAHFKNTGQGGVQKNQRNRQGQRGQENRPGQQTARTGGDDPQGRPAQATAVQPEIQQRPS